MCWQCDNPHGTIDEYLDSLRDTIADHGWVVQFVESEQRPFAYTIGLHEKGLPELLVTGMQAQTSARLLNSIAHQIVDDGMTLQANVTVEDPEAFNETLHMVQQWRKVKNQMLETVCAENNIDPFRQNLFPLPEADKPDF